MQIPVRNNKVAIFDRHILLIGSYNWMTAAEHSNDEDAIFVRTSVIAAYESAFENFGTTTSLTGASQYPSVLKRCLDGVKRYLFRPSTYLFEPIVLL